MEAYHSHNARRSWTAVTLVVLSLVVAGEELPLRVNQEAIDFGEVSAYETNRAQLELTNSSPHPIDIAASSSCPCTQVEMEHTAIPPGESRIVDVRLDLGKYPSDEVSSLVTIESKGAAPCMLQIPVTAQVRPDFVLTPAGLDFGKVKKGAQKEMKLKISVSPSVPDGLEIAELPNEIDAKLEAMKSDKEGTVYELVCGLTANNTAGPQHMPLVLKTNSGRFPSISVPLHWEILDTASRIVPRTIVFVSAKPGAEIGTVALELAPGASVVGISCSSTDITWTECPHTSDPTKRLIRLTLSDKATAGKVLATLKVSILEDGSSSDLIATVFGLVQS